MWWNVRTTGVPCAPFRLVSGHLNGKQDVRGAEEKKKGAEDAKPRN